MYKKIFGNYSKLPIAAKASFWFVICNIVQKAMSVLTIPIITRMLSTSEYGIYSVFNSYGNTLIIFATLSVYANGYYVGMKRYDDDKLRYTSSVSGLMFLLTTALFVIFLVFKRTVTAYTGLALSVWILMFIWIYGQSMVNLWFTENRYEFKYRLIVAATIFTAIATPFLKIVIISLFDKNGIDKSLGAILGLVIPVAIVGLLAFFVITLKGKTLFSKEYWKFALIFNIPLIPYYLSQTILNQADKIMIERMDSASSAGIYSVAYSLAMTINIINSAINGSFIPWQFQNMAKGNYKNVAKVINIIMLLLAAANLMLIFIAPEIIKVFAAKEYMQAIYVIPPVTIGVLTIWLTQVFINAEFYLEKNKLIATSSVMSAILNIILNAIAIPRYGFLAAGYTTLICYLANMIFHGFASTHLLKKNHMEYPFEVGKIVILTIACIGIMFLAMVLYNYAVIRYIIFAAALLIIIAKYKYIKEMLGGMLTVKK